GFDRRLSSSLWKAWHDFRHIAGRGDPGDAASRLERVFIGLYQPKFHPFDGPARTQLPFYGMTRFFDVTATASPTRGLPPARELTRLEDVASVLREDFERRNPLLS